MFHKDVENYFIPNKENNYVPHSLQKAAMVGMLFLVVLSFTATNILSLVWTGSHRMVGAVLPAVIVDLTNKERKTESLGTLSRNTVLDAAAQLKADDMAQNSYFAHYSPAGVSPWHWFGVAGYNFIHAGENLAVHFTDSSDIVDAWMASPSHRANIMNGKYTEIGIGTAAGTYEGYKTIYVVQLFGTPAVAKAAPTPTPTPTPVPVVAGASAEGTSPSKKKDKVVLAEAVNVSEQVAIVPATPVPVVVEETVEATNTPSQEPVTTTETPITSMEMTDAGPVLYSDFIATSAPGIPASIDPSRIEKTDTTPFFLKLATQPHKILQMLYIIIGLFVFFCLLLSILLEIKHQEPRQIAYGVGLMTLMFALFYVHTVLSSGAIVL